MKKIIICSIPMKERVDIVKYASGDKSVPSSERNVRYPVNTYLDMTMKSDDDLKVLLLVKKDKFEYYIKNTEDFKCELSDINADKGASIEYVVIDTDFEESKSVHELLMGKIVENIDDGSDILVDMTFGPKDLPIIVFAALNFAEKFLECNIEHILYGQASFADGKVVDTKICDMTSLYCLGSVTNTIRCNDSAKARLMLNSLLNL